VRIIADLHLHSKYSRATSRAMEPETMARWAALKGIILLGTGDFTHPLYLAELKAKLEPAEPGLYRLKRGEQEVRFVLSAEVANVYSQGGKVRRVHTLLLAPSFQAVEAINARLRRLGDLSADGRPTFGFPVPDLVKVVMDASDRCLIVPAHIWTPWFSLFGSNSGFDSLEECFRDQSHCVHALETGLSSDPPMNWRLSALDRYALISNSDAHSPNRLGREANAFNCELDYDQIVEAIRSKDPERFLFTIEFFPQEGKYHYDGHRQCKVVLSPQEARRLGGICPVCGRRLTLGVMHRVEELADRPEGFVPPGAIPARHLVPLEEILAEAMGHGPGSAAVQREWHRLVRAAGSEMRLLLDLPEEELQGFVPPRVLQGVLRARQGEVQVKPGYDGVYGKVNLLDLEAPSPQGSLKQLSLF